jgi:hypothetical protein
LRYSTRLHSGDSAEAVHALAPVAAATEAPACNDCERPNQPHLRATVWRAAIQHDSGDPMSADILKALGLGKSNSGTYLGKGEWSKTSDAGVLPSVNPATNEVIV